MYDKVSRAGITQHPRSRSTKPDVVRLVLELDRSREYEVTRTDNEIRIAVTGAEQVRAPGTPAPSAEAQPEARRADAPPTRRRSLVKSDQWPAPRTSRRQPRRERASENAVDRRQHAQSLAAAAHRRSRHLGDATSAT